MQSLRRKMDNLRVLFRKPNYSPHLLALTATWAKEDITDKEFEIPGYTLFRKDRGNKGGGIAIHARDDLIVTRRDDLETSDVEGLWLEFIFQSLEFFFWERFIGHRILPITMIKILCSNWTIYWMVQYHLHKT